MHLLHTKSWHVKSAANIARVKRDEEEARKKELELATKALAAERESRLELLRARTSRHQHPTPNPSSFSSTSAGQHAPPPSSFLAPHSTDAVFVDDLLSDGHTLPQQQLLQDRHDLTQFRTDDGHFNFFARPQDDGPPSGGDLFASTTAKSSSRKAQDKQFARKRSGANQVAATEDDTFRLGGKPLDVPWYQRPDDHQGSDTALVSGGGGGGTSSSSNARKRNAHCDWHDPIYDMGFRDRKRELADPRGLGYRKHGQAGSVDKGNVLSNADEEEQERRGGRRQDLPREHIRRGRSRSRSRSRSRDRWRQSEDDASGQSKARSSSKQGKKTKRKSKRRDPSSSRNQDRDRDRSSPASHSRRLADFEQLREERLQREAAERVRVQELMAANGSVARRR